MIERGDEDGLSWKIADKEDIWEIHRWEEDQAHIEHLCPQHDTTIRIAVTYRDSDCAENEWIHPPHADGFPSQLCGLLLRTHSVCPISGDALCT